MARAQDEHATPELPPLKVALNNAREAARNNNTDTAVAEPRKMADAGFTSVGVITGA